MKIKVGSTQYELKVVPNQVKELKVSEDENNDGVVICGHTHPATCEVLINSELNNQVRKQTVWHELVHCFLHELGMDELNCDEGFVNALSKQIYAFLNENKLDKVYSYLEK